MTPEKTEKIIEKTWYSRIFTDRFLLDAAGRIIHQLYRNPLALCQCPVNTDGIQPVKTGDPEQNRNDKNNNKIPDFLFCNAQNIPD